MAGPGKRERERARKMRRAERRAARKDHAGGGAPIAPPVKSASEPVRGALVPVIDDTLRWHMARTAPLLGPLGRKYLDEALTKHEVRAYRPRVSEIVVRRGRRVVRHTPLMPKVLIVGVKDEDHLRAVANLPGVAEIVSQPEIDTTTGGNIEGYVLKPARLDPEALQRFMLALANGEIVKPLGISKDSQVIVRNGPFSSFPAIVEEILPNDRIKVAVSIFGRPSPVELGIADVTLV